MYKDKILPILFIIFLYANANSQISKGYWLVGGNISYSSTNFKSDFGSKAQVLLNSSHKCDILVKK